MTQEQIDTLDGIRVWHEEQAELAAMHAKKARINRQGFIFKEEHHRVAAELIAMALAEIAEGRN